MLYFIFLVIVLTICNGQDSPLTQQPSQSTPKPLFFELGFIVGMSIMGGLILMIILFMSITACQRAHKRKKANSKPNQKPVSEKKDVVIEVTQIENNIDGENVKTDSGPF